MVKQITSLGTCGGPGLPLGLRSIAFMSDINFMLRLAGTLFLDFTPVSPEQSVREDDEGIRMIVQVVDGDDSPVNIRAATSKVILLMRPDGTTQGIAGTLFSNGADGKMYFLSSVSTPPFDQAGVWWLQARVTIGGVTQTTQWTNFAVEPTIVLS